MREVESRIATSKAVFEVYIEHCGTILVVIFRNVLGIITFYDVAPLLLSIGYYVLVEYVLTVSVSVVY